MRGGMHGGVCRGVRGGYECKKVIQGAQREYAEGCAEGLSAKRSFKVCGGGMRRGARRGCAEGLSAKRSFKVRRGGAWRGAWRV